MKALEYSMIFAFSRSAGQGNPAGVVWDAEGLTDEDMQRIARINGLSETAFVFLQNSAVNPYSIRFFTPKKMIPMCGHASVASAYFYWKHMGMPDQLKYVQTTDSGNLMIKIGVNSAESFTPKIHIEMDKPRLNAVLGDIKDEICDALNLTKSDIHGEWPIVKNEKGYLFIPLKDLDKVRNVNLDIEKMKALDEENELHGWFVFSDQTEQSENNYHCRFFAPSYGVDEDPVTGTANAYFGIYHQAYIGDGGDCTLKNEQGNESEVNGIVEVEYKVEDGRVSEIWVGGYATEYLEGKIRY